MNTCMGANKLNEFPFDLLSDVEQLEVNLKAEYEHRELQLQETMEQNVRQLEDEKKQLKKKVAALETALKQTVEKVEVDQKSLQIRHELQLNTEKQTNLKLRGEAAMLRKTISRLFICLLIRS